MRPGASLGESLGAVLRSLPAHPDPLVAAGNLVALVVAWNQPFYPFYIWWSSGRLDALVFLTWLSTPFFLAVPFVARRHPRGSRAMLALVGIANTVLCTKIFGAAAGVELFLAPCLILSTALFPAAERRLAFALAALGLLVLWGLHGRYGAAWIAYTAAQSERLLLLNAVSVGGLMVFIGYALPKPVSVA